MNANDLRHMDDLENGNDPQEPLTVNARYKAKVKGGSIDMSAPELPIELKQMIVWIMHSSDAAQLLPAYRELRQQCTERDEAQKTYCGQDI